MMSGSASGTSTWKSICRPVMPMPRAARTTSWSTSRMPTYALVSRGGTANRTSATTVGPSPNRPIGVSSSRTRTAKVGTARPTLERLTARAPPLPRWPRTRAMGSAMRQLISRQTTVSTRC